MFILKSKFSSKTFGHIIERKEQICHCFILNYHIIMTVTSQNVYYINPVADKNRRTLSCHYLNIYFGCSQLRICLGSVKDNPVCDCMCHVSVFAFVCMMMIWVLLKSNIFHSVALYGKLLSLVLVSSNVKHKWAEMRRTFVSFY